MLFRNNRKLSLAALALAGGILLAAGSAEARDSRWLSRLAPVPQDWQEVWGQLLSWFGLGGERDTSESPDDQQWSHSAGKEDAGPYIDPNGGLPRLDGTGGKGDSGTAIEPIGSR